MDRAGKGRAGVDDVDGAEPKPLVDLVLVAELRGREYRDLVAAIGALLDLVGRPQRFGMIGLGDLVDMRPFEFRLRGGGCDACRDDETRGKNQTARPDGHRFLPKMLLRPRRSGQLRVKVADMNGGCK